MSRKVHVEGKADEDDVEAVNLTKIPPNLPKKMCEKYNLQGVSIMAATKSGVAFVSYGNMNAKTVISAIKACDEYRQILEKALQEKLSEG